MVTLQKFKLFTMQCQVAGSSTRSPTTNPVIHIDRRKTLNVAQPQRRWEGRRLPPQPGDQERTQHPARGTTSPSIVSRLLSKLFTPISTNPSVKISNRRSARGKFLIKLVVEYIGRSFQRI
ncbi:unnamed protein product [Fraxinus pennsylvanica]|uniref:Uncharacterized protein n=1 Tax=Fraxinus pennsylvanica TaxID=56036 RepID=A0AAD1Z093_9LAMI|nr:unnamed protein product [Fraxinus pennsylvanica]